VTKRQWIIIAALALGVLLFYGLGGIMLLQMVRTQSAQVVSTSALEPTMAAAATAKSTAIPLAMPTARATATRVIQSGQAQTTATRFPSQLATASGTSRPASQFAESLSAAWDKSRTAASYRMEFAWVITGNLSDIPAGWDTSQGFPLFSLAASVNGKDSQVVMKGLFAVFLSGDPTKSVEFMTLGDKSYVKGPLPLLGAPEDKWYVATGQLTQTSMLRADDFLDSTSRGNADWASFKKTASEPFDGKQCDVYTGDQAAMSDLFQSLHTQGTPVEDSPIDLDKAEAKFWVCDDGYLHQMIMNMEGHLKAKPTEPISFQVRLHHYDQNTDLKLTPPTNPAPLETPSFFLTAPTPKPK
jgi:hypothetical protein